MRYLQVSVSTVHEGADLVASVLFDEGSDGVMVRDGADVRELVEKKISWDYVDEELLKSVDDKVSVVGFFPEDYSAAGLEVALSELKAVSSLPLGSLETSASVINSEDWENEWRKYYAPIEIGGVTIVPAWLKHEGGSVPVFVEPGMAFGTGNHETTALCVKLMQDVDLTGKTVVDIGCGSGILGITAAKLGAASVLLSDLDPLAVEATRSNIALNGVSGCEVRCGDLELGGKSADVVLANITADVLVRLYDKLGGALNAGGYAILSGIIHARADEVLARYEVGFDVIKREKRGEWQALLLKKK